MKLEDIKTIAMYGAGTIGGGFAAYFALKGLNVNVYVRSEGSIERAKPKIQEAVDTYVKYGLVDSGDGIWAKIKFTTDPAEAFTGVYFVQENGAENLEQKHQMVATMEQYLPVDAIIASSSSGTPVTQIASEAKHPERIIVAHPFNPAYLLPLIEICGGEKTSPEVIEFARAFYKKYDKAPVVLNKEKNGFIANRLMHALWREEIALVTEGVCSMADCDDAWTFGPGIRLAAFGPSLHYELGGGDLGLKGCAIKVGAMTDAVVADISDMKKVPDTWADQSGEEIGPLMENLPDVIGHTKPEIADFRDKVIIDVLKLHKRM
ncbi:MAG: 3-hydroxyacyl-CoA dehydrogenase family protein [Oscillospiraceae bacterium]|nr:3-hydroxyacyl-CoA dehydrogenase family protein [Oscillospiraceae bacterium]